MRLLSIIFITFASTQLFLAALAEDIKKDSREPQLDTPIAVSDTVTEGWISQRLDNFNAQDSRTFNMRYLMNRDHLQSGGPIFIVS